MLTGASIMCLALSLRYTSRCNQTSPFKSEGNTVWDTFHLPFQTHPPPSRPALCPGRMTFNICITRIFSNGRHWQEVRGWKHCEVRHVSHRCPPSGLLPAASMPLMKTWLPIYTFMNIQTRIGTGHILHGQQNVG